MFRIIIYFNKLSIKCKIFKLSFYFIMVNPLSSSLYRLLGISWAVDSARFVTSCDSFVL